MKTDERREENMRFQYPDENILHLVANEYGATHLPPVCIKLSVGHNKQPTMLAWLALLECGRLVGISATIFISGASVRSGGFRFQLDD